MATRTCGFQANLTASIQADCTYSKYLKITLAVSFLPVSILFFDTETCQPSTFLHFHRNPGLCGGCCSNWFVASFFVVLHGHGPFPFAFYIDMSNVFAESAISPRTTFFILLPVLSHILQQPHSVRAGLGFISHLLVPAHNIDLTFT